MPYPDDYTTGPDGYVSDADDALESELQALERKSDWVSYCALSLHMALRASETAHADAKRLGSTSTWLHSAPPDELAMVLQDAFNFPVSSR